MNRSYSKVRHIQEANKKLEQRLIGEQIQYSMYQKDQDPDFEKGAVGFVFPIDVELYNVNPNPFYKNLPKVKIPRGTKLNLDKSKRQLVGISGSMDIVVPNQQQLADTVSVAFKINGNDYWLDVNNQNKKVTEPILKIFNP